MKRLITSAAVLSAVLASAVAIPAQAHAADTYCIHIAATDGQIYLEPGQVYWHAFAQTGPYTSALFNQSGGSYDFGGFTTLAAQTSNSMWVGAANYTPYVNDESGWFVATYTC